MKKMKNKWACKFGVHKLESIIPGGVQVNEYGHQIMKCSKCGIQGPAAIGMFGKPFIFRVENSKNKDIMNLNELSKECYKIAEEHGFWRTTRISEKLLLIHTEVSEATEIIRNEKNLDKLNAFSEELADIIIRTLDLAGGLNIDLQSAVERKMEINKNRPYKHNKNF